MIVTEKVIHQLDDILLEGLESDIVSDIAEKLDISPSDAMRVYYASPLAAKIEAGEYGMQYLDASYLSQEVLRRAEEYSGVLDEKKTSML